MSYNIVIFQVKLHAACRAKKKKRLKKLASILANQK